DRGERPADCGSRSSAGDGLVRTPAGRPHRIVHFGALVIGELVPALAHVQGPRHEVVEFAVAGEMTARIAPAAHLLPDPRGEAGRRVDEGVADGLRACALLFGVAGLVVALVVAGRSDAASVRGGRRGRDG